MPREIISTSNAPTSPLHSQGVKAGSLVVVNFSVNEKMPFRACRMGGFRPWTAFPLSGLRLCSFRQATHGELTAVPPKGPAPAAADTHRSCWCAAITAPPRSVTNCQRERYVSSA